MRIIPFGRGLVCAALAVAVFAAPTRAGDDSKVAGTSAAGVSQFLPDGTMLVLSFNIKQLLGAPLVKSDEKAFKDRMSEMRKTLEGFGVDPEKDLSRVFLAAGMDFQKALVLLEGRFDTDKLNAKLKELAKKENAHLSVADDDNLPHYKLKVPKAPIPQAGLPNEVLMTPLNGQFLALAMTKDALSDAVAKKGGKKPEVKKDVVDLVGKINPKETFSVVVVPPEEVLAASPVPGLTTVTGGVTVAEGVKTDILLSTKDAESAKSLADMINEGLTQVKQILPLIAAQQPNFGPKEQKMVQDMMDTFKATAGDNGVKLQSNITKEFIDKNAKKDK
jgi:hypothetical protein